MMLAVEGVDISAHLASIALPTLVLHGGRDVISPLAHARALAEALPHAALEVLDEAGHVPTITRPQWVADQINRFFALGGP
jgi:pimeloyl-ACP methyl ester carboxylesterase